MQRHLLANNVPYVVGQDEYFYKVNGVPYRLSVKDEVITVECMGASKTEHYVFPINRPDILLEHYEFTSRTLDKTDVTHTRITSNEDQLYVTTAGLTFESNLEKDSCANKIVFFSNDLIGNGLYDLIFRVRFIDDAVAVGAIQDIPRETELADTIDAIHILEAEIKAELACKQLLR